MNWLLTLLLAGAVTTSPDCMIIEFTKNDCGPCKQLQPTLEHLKRGGMTVRTVDVDIEPLLVRRFAIESVPTLIIVNEGREVDRIVGAAPYEKIVERLAKVKGVPRDQNAELGRFAAQSQPATQQVVAPQLLPQSNPQLFAQSSIPSQADSGLTVRGQSPSLNAFPMLASAANATAAVASQVRSEVNQFAIGNAFESKSASAVAAASFEQPANRVKTPMTIQDAIARAEAATVRIRVDEENSTAYGTGTIIDVHGDEALVLTCGHLFREMKPHSQLTIDLYAGRSQPMNLPAQLIDFRADPGAEDVGLISFKLPFAVEPVALLPKREQLAVGQPAFSFGCDHGENPTRRDTKIKSIDRYVGAANVEIAGAPAVGRSGGGLFDNQGRLIGVCNAADNEDDEGIYAAAQIVYTQIERLGLAHLFDQNDAQTAPVQLASGSDNPVAATFAALAEPRTAPGTLASPGAGGRENQIRWPDEASGVSQSRNADTRPSAGFSAQPTAIATSSSPPAAKQMICILRDANGRDQVVTVEAPPAELVDAIHRQANR